MLMIHYEMMSDYSWQNSKSRTPEDYKIAPDPVNQPRRFEEFWRWIKGTAVALAPEAETGISFFAIKAVLADWCRVLPSEAASWAKGKKPNDPIFDEAAWVERKTYNRQAQVRIYDNVVDLLLAIIGHIRSQTNLKFETLLAARVLKNAKINRLLLEACAAVIAAMGKGVKGDAKGYVLGEYKKLHKQPSLSAWVAAYKTLPVQTNIEVLHDIARSFDTVEKWPDSWAEPPKTTDQALLAQQKKVADQRGFTSKSTMRHEDPAWAARARFADLPVWAGPSALPRCSARCSGWSARSHRSRCWPASTPCSRCGRRTITRKPRRQSIIFTK